MTRQLEAGVGKDYSMTGSEKEKDTTEKKFNRGKKLKSNMNKNGDQDSIVSAIVGNTETDRRVQVLQFLAEKGSNIPYGNTTMASKAWAELASIAFGQNEMMNEELSTPLVRRHDSISDMTDSNERKRKSNVDESSIHHYTLDDETSDDDTDGL